MSEANDLPTPQPQEAEKPVKKNIFGRPKKEKKKKSVKQEILEWVLTLLAALVFALVIRSFVGQPVRVDGSSMWGTLVDGEIMLVSKTNYASIWIPTWKTIGREIGYLFDGRNNAYERQHATNTDEDYIKFTTGGDPQRFDVVICHYPNRGDTNFVKRVVGLPGDTISIHGGKLTVNGVTYEEPYLINRPDYELRTYTVPEGKYFVLGDNRSNSNDSHLVGPIDRNMITAKVEYVLLPFDRRRAVPNGLNDAGEHDLTYLYNHQ